MNRAKLLALAGFVVVLSCNPPSGETLPSPPSEPVPVPSNPPSGIHAEVPEVIPMGSPFVVRLCQVPFEVSASIVFDGKYPAGGLMGWDSKTKCKRQTITGLKNPGLRVLQFALDGELQQDKFEIRVLD